MTTAESGLQWMFMKEFGFQWHITDYCNLRCRHCYQDDFSRGADLDLTAIKSIIRTIAETLTDRRLHINITGGEPFLRSDLFDILAALENCPPVAEYNIITNLLPINEQTVEQLETLGKLRQLKISLECSDSELNDSIRGLGSFKKILKNLEMIARRSTKARVLMFTLGSYNAHRVDAMLDFSRAVGADAVILERFVPMGKGLGLKDAYLKAGEWKSAVQSLINFADLGMAADDLVSYRAFYIELKDRREVRGALCNLGDESMALMPNADVFPCRRLPVKIGNLIKDALPEVMLRLRLLRQSLNREIKGKCQDCRISKEKSSEPCIGCRAIAYALTGDMYAEDPQCFMAVRI